MRRLLSAIINHTFSWIPAVAVVAGIFWFSNQPSPPFINIAFDLQDKLYHCIAYSVLGVTIQCALIRHIPSLIVCAVLVAVIGSLHGGADEFHQHFVPNRGVEFADWVADTVGVLLSLLLLPMFYRMKSGQRV